MDKTTRKFNFAVSAELLQAMEEAARSEGLSVSAWLRRLRD